MLLNFSYNEDEDQLQNRVIYPMPSSQSLMNTSSSLSSFAMDPSESNQSLSSFSSFTYKTLSNLDTFFCLTERNTTVGQEIRAGMVTFFTMAYILVVNADILSKSTRLGDAETAMDFDSVVTATALSAAIGTALVGLIGNLPFGLAPGMGLNSYFTYGICLHGGLSWHVALTCCFVQGVLFSILAVCGVCNLIQLYAPPCIKKSVTVGLGLFQALIGFECIKLIVPGDEVLLGLGDMSSARILLSLLGLLIICILLVCDVKASMLIGIAFITVTSWVTGLQSAPAAIVALPTLSNTFFALDFTTYFQMYQVTFPITLMFLFVAIFDTAGVQIMCGSQADLIDDEETLPGSTAAFFSAGFATIAGSCLGTSSVIIHNETVAGIQDGARTGLSSVTVAVMFLCTLPFLPILRAVPSMATAPPLIVVGMCMMGAAKYIDWERVDEAMPAFLTATILPLTYSIANGMIAGLIAFCVLKTTAWLTGRLTVDEESMDETFELNVSKRFKYANGRRDSLSTDPPHAGTASGLYALSDPVPGEPIPPFIDRTDHRRTIYNSTNTSSPVGYGSYDTHF